MKKSNDTLSGLALLCLCGVGAYGVWLSYAPADREIVGPNALPLAALAGAALCGLLLMAKGLSGRAAERSWGNGRAVLKVLSFFGFFVVYLAAMIFLGDFLAAWEVFPWPHNGGFAITTFLFLLCALRLLGRRRWPEILSVAFLTTAALLFVFASFFQILLP